MQEARGKPRRRKKRRRESLDEEWTPLQPMLDASCSCSGGGESSKVLWSSKRVRNGDEVQSFDSPFRNPRTFFSWLIDNRVLPLEARVHCRGGNNVVKREKIMSSGVACDWCGFVFSLTRLEAHVGCTKHRPAASIFLESGSHWWIAKGKPWVLRKTCIIMWWEALLKTKMTAFLPLVFMGVKYCFDVILRLWA